MVDLSISHSLKDILMRKSVSWLAGAVIATAALSAQAQTKWDLPSAYSPSIFHVENLVEFSKDVAQASKGKLNITVHANASLYKAPEIKRAVQGNQAQLGEILLVNFANEDPIFELDGLPFLVSSYAGARKLADIQKSYLEKKLASQGMMLLFTVPWPPQGIFTNRDLKTVADMKGLKWRAYSPATSKIAELVNAQPVTIQAAELSQAMATGVIDSYMSSSATGVDTKTYEYIKKFFDTQAWIPKNAILMNKKAFDALDADTKKAVLEAGARAEARGWKLSEAKTKEYLAAWTKNGGQIIPPSPELTKGLNDIGQKMLADYLKKAGKDGQAIVDALKK
jgi:TRAP-type C4-dicarboxylate transport system substrate-binding protein